MKRFDSVQTISEETHTMLQNLAKDPSNINLEHILDSDQYHAYFDRYQMFQDSIRRGEMGKTAQFWLQYMDVINMILALIKANKENDLNLHIASLYELCQMFFAYDHCNYTRYVPVYMMTLLNMSATRPGATELLQRSVLSVCRSSVPKCRNPVDITIEQTFNKHAKCQGGIVGFSRNYAAYYRWCTTRHCRAKYVEAVLELTDMNSGESSLH